MLFTSRSNNEYLILQVYYPHYLSNKSIQLAYRQSYLNNNKDFGAWQYIYANDYTDKNIESKYISFRNGLLIQWGVCPVSDAGAQTMGNSIVSYGKIYTYSLSYKDWNYCVPIVTRRGGGDSNLGLVPWDASWNGSKVLINFENTGGNAYVVTIGFVN